MEAGAAFGQVCHYIHLNPVRAGLVAPNKALDYPWSSLPAWPGNDRPLWLESAVVLSEAGGLPDTRGGWKKYADYLEFLATDPEKKRTSWRRSSAAGGAWVAGSSKRKCAERRPSAARIWTG